MTVKNIETLYGQYREYVFGPAGFIGIFAGAGLAFFISFMFPITALEWLGIMVRSPKGALQYASGSQAMMGVTILVLIIIWLNFFIALSGLLTPIMLCGTVYVWARWHARAGTPLELLKATIDYALKRAGYDGVPETIQKAAKSLEKLGCLSRLNQRHLQWQGRLCSRAIAAAYRLPQV